jgi:hypothetical protein
MVARRILALSFPLGTLALAVALAPGWELWGGALPLGVSLALAVAVASGSAALWTGSVAGRRAVGAAVLFGGSAILFASAGGAVLFGFGPPAYSAALGAAVAIAGVGVVLRRRWARWLALALGAAGGLSAGMNLVWFLPLAGAATWTFALWTAGCALIVAMLAGSDVASADRLGAREEVWRRRDPVVAWMRAAVVTALTAAPMLIVYGWLQAGAVPALRTPALVLAGFLVVAAAIAGSGRLFGALLLAAGAGGLLALSAGVLALAAPGIRTFAGYYLVFWIPAAVCALVCAAQVARAASRLRLGEPASPQ